VFKKLIRLIRDFDRADLSVKEIRNFKKKKKFFDIKEILLFEYSLNSKSEKFNRIIKKYLDIK